jgi:hypothetical protein
MRFLITLYLFNNLPEVPETLEIAMKFQLLNIDANAKTSKGQKLGFLTAILYLIPADGATLETLCQMATVAGCVAGCLNTAGRGGMSEGNKTFKTPSGTELPDNTVQRARLRRTMMFLNDRAEFMRLLVRELKAALIMAGKRGLKLVVRLNGTSDIRWEDIATDTYSNVFEQFAFEHPDVQFYDYTKLPNRRRALGIANYHLTFSYSHRQEFAKHVVKALEIYGNLVNYAVVFRGQYKGHMPDTFLGRDVVSGDESDLRFLDAPGVVVGLYAKGRAKRDTSGFTVPVTA